KVRRSRAHLRPRVDVRQGAIRRDAPFCRPSPSETSMSRTLHVVCPHCDTINRVPSERLHQAGKCGACHRPLFERRPVELNNLARFEKQLNNSDIPLLVDFWAAWCGPCRAMAPILEQAATDLEPNVRVVKVDSEAVPELTRRFFIQSIPTLLIV